LARENQHKKVNLAKEEGIQTIKSGVCDVPKGEIVRYWDHYFKEIYKNLPIIN
jgi:hypothetical protein